MDYFEELSELADYLVIHYEKDLLSLIRKRVSGEISAPRFEEILMGLEFMARMEMNKEKTRV